MKTQKFRLAVMIILIVASALLMVAGFVFLPDTLTVQVTLDGEAGNTMPKAPGLILPFALCAAFAYLYFRNREAKFLFVSAVGLAVTVIIFIFNAAAL